MLIGVEDLRLPLEFVWTCSQDPDRDAVSYRVAFSARGGGSLAKMVVPGCRDDETGPRWTVADGLLAEPTDVSSPTFTLIHEYRGRLPLVHSDLYRLTAAQLEDTGLNDYLDGHTVTAIEWADRWGDGLPSDRLDVHLSHRPPAARRAILTARGPAARRLLDALRSRLSANRPTRAAQQTRVQLNRPRRASH